MENQIIPRDAHLQQIEIHGVKFEVDLREAKRINTFKVGDPVKILKKEYSDTWKQHCGVIVDFTEFARLPTITIAYLEENYNETKINFVNINSETNKDDLEIAPCNPFEMEISKPDILGKLDRDIIKKQEEMREIEFKKAVFTKYFNKYFEKVVIDKTVP